MDHPVLVYGESGAGKTFLGRLIHAHSRRSDGNFVSIDCACMSKVEVEQKLFGLRGRGKRPGLIDRARGGTLFIGRIELLSPRCQSRLFRALSEAPRNDAGDLRHAPFRLIASTHSRLEPLVESGKFSKDLYYRIHVFSIHLPPLRERPEDAISLAEGFLQEFSQMTGRPISLGKGARMQIKYCLWPGNIRELRSCVLRVAAANCTPVIERLPCRAGSCLASLSQASSHTVPIVELSKHPAPLPTPVSLHAELTAGQQPLVDPNVLVAALERSGWVQAKAARQLQLTIRQIQYAIQKYQIKVKRL
jgi:Nif-specific regulatory protein